MSRSALAAALVVLGGCVGHDDTGSGAGEMTVVLPPDEIMDSDGDGLCDITEDHVGTDPGAADSDADGLSDLEELTTGFDPTNAELPSADQLVHLAAERGAATEFAVRATVQGTGGSVSGFFEALPFLDPDGLNAADFFHGAVAVAADPIDAVRSIHSESSRFAAVLGKTRLAFSLRFEYPIARLDPAAVTCTRTYPFRYAIKADDGTLRANGYYLLRVIPAGSSADAAPYCLPVTCQ